MGAVSFGLDPRLVERIATAQPLEVFVETGTFRGDTVAAMLPYFEQLVSIELSEPLYAEANARFARKDKVRVVRGDSPEVLRRLHGELRERAVVFWLDAHWCASEGSAGDRSQCPLLRELQAIDTVNERSLILIDDARLFLAPPPYPHEVSQWPSMAEILQQLQALGSGHVLNVINDVIVFAPARLTDAVREYARTYGVDWLAAQQALADQTHYGGQLVEKERVIQDLAGALESSREVIKAQKDAAAEARASMKEEKLRYDRWLQQKDALVEELSGSVRSLQEFLADKDRMIHELQVQLDAGKEANEVSEGRRLQLMLEEKEEVIRTLANALRAYRAVFFIGRPLLSLPSRFRNHLTRGLTPRLGRLIHHPPRPMSMVSPVLCRVPEAQLPRISLVTPSFQQGRFIERTVRSVLGQGYPDLEYFVQDGGSSDETAHAIEPYLKDISGWESRPDDGQSQAINLGFAQTSGEIMAWLNSDDLLLPGALHSIGEFFARNPDVDVVYGNRILIDDDDNEIGRWILPPHSNRVLSWADFVPQETLFWRRRIWDRAGGFVDEAFRFAMDWDLLLRFRDVGARMVRMPRFLGAFRVHEFQKTSAAISDLGFEEMARLRERVHGCKVSVSSLRRAIAPYLVRHVMHHVGFSLRERFTRWPRG